MSMATPLRLVRTSRRQLTNGISDSQFCKPPDKTVSAAQFIDTAHPIQKRASTTGRGVDDYRGCFRLEPTEITPMNNRLTKPVLRW